jgi:hypothetical protein
LASGLQHTRFESASLAEVSLCPVSFSNVTCRNEAYYLCDYCGNCPQTLMDFPVELRIVEVDGRKKRQM